MGLINEQYGASQYGEAMADVGLAGIKSELEHQKMILAGQIGDVLATAKDQRDQAGLINKTRAEGDVKVDVAQRTGEVGVHSADVLLKNAQADYWKGAKANEAQAKADALAAGKVVGPKIKAMKGESGDYMVDENSGAIGIMAPGTPAKESVWHAFKANEPATPEKLAHTIWSTADGQPLPGGPFSLYKQLPVNKAGGIEKGPSTLPDPAMFDPNAKKAKPAAEPTKSVPAPSVGLMNQEETPLQKAQRMATERGNASDAESVQSGKEKARASIADDAAALQSGELDVKSQENYRRLFKLSSSPAVTPAEKVRVLQLLKQY